MGLDVMYSKIQTANFGAGTVTGFGTNGFPEPRALGGRWFGFRDRPGQLVVPVPRPSRLLSLIA